MYQILHGDDFIGVEDRRQHGGLTTRNLTDDVPFFPRARLFDPDIEQKTIELGFGKRVSAFLF